MFGAQLPEVLLAEGDCYGWFRSAGHDDARRVEASGTDAMPAAAQATCRGPVPLRRAGGEEGD